MLRYRQAITLAPALLTSPGVDAYDLEALATARDGQLGVIVGFRLASGQSAHFHLGLHPERKLTMLAFLAP